MKEWIVLGRTNDVVKHLCMYVSLRKYHVYEINQQGNG